jgi:hypothetical protein
MDNTYKHLELQSDDLSLEHYKELLTLREATEDAKLVITFITSTLEDCIDFVPSDLRKKIEMIVAAVTKVEGGEV